MNLIRELVRSYIEKDNCTVGLFDLEIKWVNGNMIKIFQIMPGVENLDRRLFLSLSVRIRGNLLKLCGKIQD